MCIPMEKARGDLNASDAVFLPFIKPQSSSPLSSSLNLNQLPDVRWSLVPCRGRSGGVCGSSVRRTTGGSGGHPAEDS